MTVTDFGTYAALISSLGIATQNITLTLALLAGKDTSKSGSKAEKKWVSIVNIMVAFGMTGLATAAHLLQPQGSSPTPKFDPTFLFFILAFVVSGTSKVTQTVSNYIASR